MVTKFITQQEVADALGLSLSTIGRYVKDGRLKAVQIGRFYRIPEAELARFTAELETVEPAGTKKPEDAA